jgi:hypothetical protein
MVQDSDFEQEKWRADLALREREMALKEREQSNRDAEIDIKRAEQASSKWRSPLIVAILAAAAAATGNALVALVNGDQQRKLEGTRHEAEHALAEKKHLAESKLAQVKHDAEIKLENSKAESTRIFEMIKTGDPDKAAGNLEFLLKSGLIVEPERLKKMVEYLASRQTGTGASLPSPAPRFGFEPTSALTAPLQASLQKLLEDYIVHLKRIGLATAEKTVSVRVEDLPPGYQSSYDPSQHRMIIDAKVANDRHLALTLYNFHILSRSGHDPRTGAPAPALSVLSRSNAAFAIGLGLNDYLACSHVGDPKVSEVLAKAYNWKNPQLRLLDNQRKFGELKTVAESEFQDAAFEIWGGAFWAIRAKLDRDVADRMMVAAWLNITSWPEDNSLKVSKFIEELLAAAKSKVSERDVDVIRSILREREFPVPQP